MHGLLCFLNAEYEETAREAMMAVLCKGLCSGSLKSLFGNSNYRRYVKMEDARLFINENAIQVGNRHDGECVLETNSHFAP
jgi:hypothetical protein